MEHIPAQEFFADALHYRPHEDTPLAVISAKKARNWLYPGMTFANGNEQFQAVMFDFPNAEIELVRPHKGDAINSAWVKPHDKPAYLRRTVISKEFFEASYVLAGDNYHLKPFQKKLVKNDFMLVSKDASGKEQRDFIAAGSDLVWRGGMYSYETNPLTPGLSEPLMAGVSLFEGISAAYHKAGIPSLIPTMNTDIGTYIRLDKHGNKLNPYVDLMNSFAHMHDYIKQHMHRLSFPSSFLEDFEAHRKDMVRRFTIQIDRSIARKAYAPRNHRH